MNKSQIGAVEVDFDALTMDGPAGSTSVEPKVMEVLQLLASAPGEVFTRDAIIEGVWGGSFGGDERLSRAISLLRKALGDERGQHAYILTVPRRGYRLIAEVKSVGSNPGTAIPNGAPESPPVSEAAQRGHVPTLAVLPFVNMSGLADADLFLFAMVEDVVDSLSQSTTARVKASAATASYGQGPNIDLKALATELDVRYAVHGSVRTKGKAILVNAHLIDVDTGDLLWKERFEVPADELHDRQEGIARELAAHLRSETYRVERERILQQSQDQTAWEAVMRSIASVQKMTAEGIMQAIAEVELAIRLDPNYGLAHALLAQNKGILYFQAVADDPEMVADIRQTADWAVELDPEDSLVLGTAGAALTTIGFPDEGLACIERAIKLNPDNQFAFSGGVMAATMLDRLGDAQAYFDKIFELTTTGPTDWASCIWLSHAYIRAGNWEEAEKYAGKALDAAPNAGSHFVMAIINRQIGKDNSAVDHFQKARRSEPETPLALWLLRFGRAYVGNLAGTTFLGHFEYLWKQTEPV